MADGRARAAVGQTHGGQKGDITPDWIEAFLHTQMESGRACRAAATPVLASPGLSLIDRLESCFIFQAPRYHLSLDAPRLGVVECAGNFMHEDGGKPAAAAAAASLVLQGLMMYLCLPLRVCSYSFIIARQ